MTEASVVVLNNGHGPMLSNDRRGRMWMECLTRWMAENNLCGGRQTESFILPTKKQLADSQEVVPNTWDIIRQKRQICYTSYILIVPDYIIRARLYKQTGKFSNF